MNSRNIRLLIAFDGGGYSGWQRQANAVTIQGTIEDRLSIMTSQLVTLHGAGRTDAGVHARGMVANFTTESRIPPEGFTGGLNSLLPPDIRVLHTSEETLDFHSRYSAKGKRYSYCFNTGEVQLPTERLYTSWFPGTFDSPPVITALAHLTGTHDFTSFEGSGSRDPNSSSGRGAVRTLFQADLVLHPKKPDTWTFIFTGDGFLRHMVRNMVGTLMEVGRGRKDPEEIAAIRRMRDRRSAGPTAPACGLMLEEVFYSLPEGM